MNDAQILDEMRLPSSNPKEELETLSVNFFKPLFDVAKFEIRSEDYRDKGIDMTVELKRAGKHLNFRFSIQLKATANAKLNNDNSISLTIDTSNINYLLNSGMPAFYVLYSKSTNTFYYEHLNDFISRLTKNHSDWNDQKSHTLRFEKQLSDEGIQKMYDITLEHGLFQRKINEKLALKSAVTDTGDKILLDVNLNVTDDAQIRRLIENIGLELINEAKWKEILEVHKKASGNAASTAKYNLVLGIAHYYNGELINALAFFKTAIRLQSELSGDLKSHLHYFETSVKFALGLISKNDYYSKMSEFDTSENLGQYIRFEKAKRNYAEATDIRSEERYNQFIDDINAIMNDPATNESLKLNVRCDMVLIKGEKNNMDQVRIVAMVNAVEAEIGINIELRANAVRDFIQAHSQWHLRTQQLKKEAKETRNYFAYFVAAANEAKVLYEFEVCSGLITIEQDRPGISAEMPDKKPLFDYIDNLIGEATKYYTQIGHIENQIVSLSIRYEILHFTEQFSDAKKIMEQMEELVDTYELTEQKRRLQHLKNHGTTHERIKRLLDDTFESVEKDKKEIQKMVAEMKEMDEKEKKEKNKMGDRFTIQLIPIHIFSFPKKDAEKVFEILNINPETKDTFRSMLNMNITPVANIYNLRINAEGPGQGNLADTGIESWRNIYRIRKAFFENKFYRVE